MADSSPDPRNAGADVDFQVRRDDLWTIRFARVPAPEALPSRHVLAL